MSQCSACMYLENSFLKQENIELNQLSECMLYKMLGFSENISKLENYILQDIFQKPCLLCYKSL